MKEKNNDIAVIGISGRFPQADNLERFWENLVTGKDSIRPFPETRKKELEEAAGQVGHAFEEEYLKNGYLDQITLFEPGYFNISEEESKYMDPQHRLALELVEEALHDAGYNSENMSGKNVGVFMALAKNTYGRFTGSSPLGIINKLESAMAGRIAYTFNFFGPAITIDTACSSSLTALHYACLNLLNNQCDYAVVGGVNIKPFPAEVSFGGRSPIISKNHCLRAFDKKADGTLGGEGGGILILKKLTGALEDRDVIHAVVKGSGMNSDGARSNGMSAPNPDAQAQLIRGVIENAKLDPRTISYIEAHGTGTELGDPIEVAGITMAFNGCSDKKQYIPIGSVKTNIGHLDAAAAVPGMMKVILALKNQKIPPSLHFEEPNPHIDFENSPVFVNDKLIPWKSRAPRRAGVTSLGLIGTNVHAILEEAPPVNPAPSRNGKNKNIFTLSARTGKSLEGMRVNLIRHLKKNPHLAPDDVAFTLNTGRRQLFQRIAVCAHTLAELAEKLELPFTGTGTSKVKYSPVFIYPDFSEESPVIPAHLHQQEIFKTHYDECIKIGGDDTRCQYFAFQYACTQMVDALGLKPKAVFGIGQGKFTADVIQGKCSPRESLINIKKYRKKDEKINQDRLDQIIRQMLQKDYNLFLDFGGSDIIRQTLEQMDQGPVYIPIDTGSDSFYSALKEMYLMGIDIDWRAFYPGRGYRKVSLPGYVFDRKSYFVNIDFSQTLTPRPGQDRSEKEIHPGGEKEPVTFDEILAIFQDRINDPMGLDLEYDFESNGGDSITVMEIVEVLKKNYHVTIKIDLFFNCQTLNQLIDEILKQVNSVEKAEKKSREKEDNKPHSGSLAAEPGISPDISKISAAREMPGKILLTGAGGFFAAHLLMELIDKTDAEIYCLTRADSTDAAHQKNKKIWDFYFGGQWEQYLDKRIFIATGDVTRPNLGMERHVHDQLKGTIDTVIHSAADVRHQGKYEHFKKVNVDGTKNVMDFCVTGRNKKMHHISTLAVAGIPTGDFCFKENHLDIGQEFGSHVYATTKFEAEIAINQARKNGLQASIYRIGTLVGRYKDGLFQQNIDTNQLYNRLKALILLGKIVSRSLENSELEITPVDLCSRAAVNLMLLKDAINHNFHLMHPHILSLKELIAVIRTSGFTIEEVDYQTFARHVKNQVQPGKFVKEISRVFYNLRDENEMPIQNENEQQEIIRYHFDNNFTVQVLEKTGFSWPDLGTPYLEKMFQYCKKVGYI